MQESAHTHNDSKVTSNSHSEIGKSVEGRNHLQYWNHEMLAKHAARRVGSPTSHSLPDNHMLHHNSGKGVSRDPAINSHLPRTSQYSSHQRAKSSSPSEIKSSSSSHFHHHNAHSKHSQSHVAHQTYSPVDLAAESLLSLSGSVPRRSCPFPAFQNSSGNEPSCDKNSRPHPKDSIGKANHLRDSASPFTKVSQINKLSTSEGYAVFSNPVLVGSTSHASHPTQGGLLPGEKITTPSPKVHVLPTHISSDSYKSEGAPTSASFSAIPKQSSKSEISPNGTPPVCKTPERSEESPFKFSVSTPEEEERLRMLSKNEKVEVPKCGCLGE